MVRIHTNNQITVTNLVISSLDTASLHNATLDWTYQVAYTSTRDSILTNDINAHLTIWYSYTDDHRGSLISNIIINSNNIAKDKHTY